jgi:hypothetical protein
MIRRSSVCKYTWALAGAQHRFPESPLCLITNTLIGIVFLAAFDKRMLQIRRQREIRSASAAIVCKDSVRWHADQRTVQSQPAKKSKGHPVA